MPDSHDSKLNRCPNGVPICSARDPPVPEETSVHRAMKNSESKGMNKRQISSAEARQATTARLAKQMARLNKIIKETTDTAPQTDSSMPQRLKENQTKQIQSCMERLDVLEHDRGREDRQIMTICARIERIGQCLDRLETHAEKTQLFTEQMGDFVLSSMELIRKRLDTANENVPRYDESLDILIKTISPLRELIECLTRSHFSVLKQVGLINTKLLELGNFRQPKLRKPQEQDGEDVGCGTGASNIDSETADFVVVSD